MKKYIAATATSITAFLLTGSQTFAATLNACPEDNGSGFRTLCELTSGKFSSLFSKVITLVFIVAVLIALAFLIFGGIKWILSGGDSKAVDSARAMIVAAIVGLVIVFLAYFILNFVIGFFVPGFSLSNITLPSLQ